MKHWFMAILMMIALYGVYTIGCVYEADLLCKRGTIEYCPVDYD